jgi:hypothetical protein
MQPVGRFYRADELPDELPEALDNGDARMITSRADMPDDMQDMARQIDSLLPPGNVMTPTTFGDLLRAHERAGTGTPEQLTLLRDMARVEASFNAQLSDFEEEQEIREAVDRSVRADPVPDPADPDMIARLFTRCYVGPEAMCPVCQEDVEREAEYLDMACDHVLHRACALRWFKSGSTCPVCKRPPA